MDHAALLRLGVARRQSAHGAYSAPGGQRVSIHNNHYGWLCGRSVCQVDFGGARHPDPRSILALRGEWGISDDELGIAVVLRQIAGKAARLGLSQRNQRIIELAFNDNRSAGGSRG